MRRRQNSKALTRIDSGYIQQIIIQMSYHYRADNKREVLLRQLNQVENDLNTKNQSLERLKLEAEFYQDKDKPIHKDKLSLADEIMNELIAPSQPPYHHQPIPAKQEYRAVEPIKAAAFKPMPDNNQRENNFINQREIQKNKLQNQKHEGLFPNSSDNNRVRSTGKQQQYIPEKDKVEPKLSPYAVNPSFKKALSPEVEPSFNPFVRGDQLLKQKREQSHREYLRQLQLQRQQQQRLKEEREIQKKLIKGQFHDYLPNKAQPEKPIAIKKNDPNSKPPKVEGMMGNFSQFDSNLIRSKGIEIKSKYKKGKITYQECQREINNLRKQYNGNLDDLLQNKLQKEKEGDKQKEKEREVVNQPVTQRSHEEPVQLQQQPFSHSLPLKQESINYSHFAPQEAGGRGSSLNYTLPPQMPYGVPAHIPSEYLQLMKKMFEVCMKQVKEVYSQRIVSQDQAYQETLNKFVQYTQNNFMTQQIPPIPSQQQKEFYSDNKQLKQLLEKESNVKRKLNPSSGESLSHIPQAENYSYYDKSLSAIASKIPYLKTEKEEARESEVHLFYSRKYKVKKMEKFAFLSDPKQSNIEIPSTSTYLRNSNALQELQARFHQDLTELRKLQSQQNSHRFASRLTQNAAYSSERRVVGESKVGAVGSGSGEVGENPFLKRHISRDENMMTFNQKELRINSPINSYSPQSKKEILEQDEYQTEPRVREDAKKVPNYVQEYEQQLNSLPNKALNFININNELLRKYQKTEQSRKELIMVQDASALHQKDSNYFTNNDISPVKRNDYYEESLQTIRSDFEPPNSKRQPIHHPTHSRASPSKPKQSQLSQPEQSHMAGYSQTVESIEESSAKNSRPPVAKRRTISKKKESSIARSKINQDSSLSKPYNDSSLRDEQPLKFDSNVYESQYEESAQIVSSKKPHPQITANARFQTDSKEGNIEIYAPTIVTPKSALEIEGQYSSLEKPKAVQNKLKSLEEARKLAKEYRVKATEQSRDYRSVEQRFSELQSFMTKRGDESVSVKKERKEGKEGEGKGGRRDIMRMLQQLQQQQNYKQDFQSYREQSQQYQ